MPPIHHDEFLDGAQKGSTEYLELSQSVTTLIFDDEPDEADAAAALVGVGAASTVAVGEPLASVRTLGLTVEALPSADTEIQLLGAAVVEAAEARAARAGRAAASRTEGSMVSKGMAAGDTMKARRAREARCAVAAYEPAQCLPDRAKCGPR